MTYHEELHGCPIASSLDILAIKGMTYLPTQLNSVLALRCGSANGSY